VGNPAEETYCYPNDQILRFSEGLSIRLPRVEIRSLLSNYRW